MELTRRRFLKLSGTVTAGLAVGGRSAPVAAEPKTPPPSWELRTEGAVKTFSICPFCSVGCGVVCHTDPDTGRVVYIEGDPDHPINAGTLCAKGSALDQLAANDRRIISVLYRAPYSDHWEEKSWEWTLSAMAERIKEARDSSFEKVDHHGWTVNRCNSIASVGSAAIDNEECWAYQAMLRALGLVYIEHQARI
jgi:formate dehydrogenase major subunit